MLHRSEVKMFILDIGVLVLILMAMLLMHWWDMRQRKKFGPAKAAINRLKRGSIVYGIIMLALMFRLPWFYPQLVPENISEYAKELTSDLSRMRQVIYLGFMININWFWGMYSALKEISRKVVEESDEGDG